MNPIHIEDRVQEILNKKSGFFNKSLWNLRKKTKKKFWKKILDYAVIGGMTFEEQKYISEILGKKTSKLTKGNALFYTTITSTISSLPIITNFILYNTINYKGKHGIYAGLISVSWSISINATRFIYAHHTKKGIESASILALIGNSTTYIKKIKNYIKNNKINIDNQYSNNQEFLNNLKYMNHFDKKHDNIGFL